MRKRQRFLIGFVLATLAFAQADKPVPIEQEPHHHLVLQNEYVRVLHVNLPAGESTLFHIHSHDQAGVSLADDTFTQQLLGKTEGAPEAAHVGDVSAEPLPQPRIHRVHNVGTTSLDLLDIEFLKPPSGTPSPGTAAVAAENAEVRVYCWDLAPGGSSAMHAHTRPYLMVAVTPMRLKMIAPDGHSQTEDVKAGDMHWVDAEVTHAFSNVGLNLGKIAEFELK